MFSKNETDIRRVEFNLLLFQKELKGGITISFPVTNQMTRSMVVYQNTLGGLSRKVYSTVAMRMILVVPGVPKGTPAVMTM